MVAMAIYFLSMEFRKYFITWSSFTFFQITFHILVLVLYVVDRINIWIPGEVFSDFLVQNNPFEEYVYIILSSVIIVLSYFTLLIQLRTFETFAVLINLLF